MSKTKHPRNRYERKRIEEKIKFDYQTKLDRLSHVRKRIEQEAVEQKEALDELRQQVPSIPREEERTDD
jgi:hypothetical protein